MKSYMSRHPQNRRAAAKTFNKQSRKTKRANVMTGPMRGGIRL